MKNKIKLLIKGFALAGIFGLLLSCGGGGGGGGGPFSGSITTIFVSNNGFDGNMFDVSNVSAGDVQIEGSFDVSLVSGSTTDVSVYYRSGTFVGFESDPTDWILLGTDVSVTSVGDDLPTPIDVGAGFTMLPGETYGFYVTTDGSGALRYTNGANTYNNGILQIDAGVGKGTPNFTGLTFDPRTWNGTIFYTSDVSTPTPTYTLYFSQDNNGNGLYSIDPATGVGTIVGSGISGVTSSTVGLAHNSANSAALIGSQPFGISEINRDGSGFVDNGGSTQEALAYDNTAGILYGGINGNFTTVDPATGNVVTTLAAPGSDIEGLAVETATGNVFGLSGSNPALLMRYDQIGDSWSLIGSTGMNMDSVGLAYHPGTQVLFAVDEVSASIYTLNTTTGVPTLVGAHGIAGSGGGGLTFAQD